MANSPRSPSLPPDTKSHKISYFCNKKRALGKHRAACFQNVLLTTVHFWKVLISSIFCRSSVLLTFDVVISLNESIRNDCWKPSTNGYKCVYIRICVCIRICVQTDIFKYSNLIKTKKIFKTENQKTFYIFDQILQKADEWEDFWVLFFVSVLNETRGRQFSCATVNCCLIEMSNILVNKKI